MWEEGYTTSLSLLPSTLAEFRAELKSVSLEEEDRDEWDLDDMEVIINSALSLLDSLLDNGFFFFLSNLSKIGREMKSVLDAARKWNVAEVVDQVEKTLKPLHSPMSCIAPKKAYRSLMDMRNYLEEIQPYDWAGEDCLGDLNVLHEHLEELKPRSCLKYLKYLHDLILVQANRLVRLSDHPLIQKKLGRLNIFTRLVFFKIDLEFALDNGQFLEEMQEILEALDHLRVINLND
ncbi:uncharacterized protein LOC132568856 [Heteronotia binoei]|uniref:uncharacterized protein LOC132568856 n=1 Tax=Heteronotia binoei TaxID=13085 RepID=UPI00292D006C|nr:uncharacterized protein LOC132568856 [Heteronotia binoei]XP_060091026.1 uncharacterized protein LOC132568856 [Heteronotia binoei]XP_060091027.1 uncharacterized protein LOC132568856 [Heteronotia binoei]